MKKSKFNLVFAIILASILIVAVLSGVEGCSDNTTGPSTNNTDPCTNKTISLVTPPADSSVQGWNHVYFQWSCNCPPLYYIFEILDTGYNQQQHLLSYTVIGTDTTVVLNQYSSTQTRWWRTRAVYSSDTLSTHYRHIYVN